LQKEVVNFILNLNDKNKEIKYHTIPDGLMSDELKEHLLLSAIDVEQWNTKEFTISITTDGEHYALYSDINKTQYAQFESNGHSFNLRDFKQYLSKRTQKMKKIFISYSKKDLVEVNKFIDHLSALRINGLVDTWYCTKLEAGQKWDAEIKRQFDEADIICFMVSSNFMQTRYILDVEVTEAFKRLERDSNFKIVPIYLNFCNWHLKDTDLQQFNALPYTLKPVADFPNPDMAWYIVEEQIRLLIENDLSMKSHITDEEPMGIPADIRKIYERIVKDEV